MTTPEFSRLFSLEALAQQGSAMLTARPSECEALARRLGILAIESVAVVVRVECLAKDQEYRVMGDVQAKVVQTSARTLEPLTQDLTAHFDVHMGGHPTTEQEDWEPFEREEVDIGELASQYLSLALNPYVKEASEPQLTPGVAASERRHNPFAGLAERVLRRGPTSS